jgi:branched-chain amino acid transport system substrate-binding protein
MTNMSEIVNHLWQSTAFILLIALVAKALRRNSPRLRYWLWFTASVKFLIPFSLIVSTGARIQLPPETPLPHVDTVAQFSMYFEPASETYFEPPPSESSAAVPGFAGFPWERALTTVWLMGVFLLSVRWFRRWRIIHRAGGQATRLPIQSSVPILSSPALMEPGVFGLFQPVLLLPEGIAERLTPKQFDAILAHELRHIKCFDNLTAAFHMVIETLFWFHPLVWWIGAKLMDERERDCDEAVLKQGSRPGDYARGIIQVCDTYVKTELPCASGISGSNLKKRVQEIMTWRGSLPVTLRGKAILVSAALTAVSIPFAIGVLQAQAGPSFSTSQPLTSRAAEIELGSISPGISLAITQQAAPQGTPAAVARSVADTEIVIGEYLALTGPTASFGISTKSGIDMAVDAVNSAGGILGKRVRIIVEDDKGIPEETQRVVTKLISQDGVIALLGAVASSQTMAAAPIAQAGRIPMISPSSTHPAVTQAGDYIFRVCLIDPSQGFVMARFAFDTLKVRNAAILRDSKSAYSVSLADSFAEGLRKIGGTILADESYSPRDTDFIAQLTKIKASNPEAIFVPGYSAEVGLIAVQAKALGLTVPLLGGDSWDYPRLVPVAGDALNGSYYSNHYSPDDPSPENQNFVAKYKERYQQAPDALAALGFDSAKLLFEAIRRANSTDPSKVRDALAQTTDFAGVTGRITLDGARNPIKPAAVLHVKDRKIEYAGTVRP